MYSYSVILISSSITAGVVALIFNARVFDEGERVKERKA